MTRSTHDLAWAAGFFDAEGNVSFKSGFRTIHGEGGLKTYRNIILQVRQVDPLTLERFMSVVGVGAIYGPYRNPGVPRSNDYFTFVSSRFEHIQAILAALWRWLSSVKREQASKALTAYLNEPRQKVGRKPMHLRKGQHVPTFDPPPTKVA